jgi:hypothetical protein
LDDDFQSFVDWEGSSFTEGPEAHGEMDSVDDEADGAGDMRDA